MGAQFRKRGGKVGKSQTSGREESRGGKIAAGSLAATIIGAVIKDLVRPNSLIRGLAAAGREKLLSRKTSPAIDITKKVQVEVASDDKKTK